MEERIQSKLGKLHWLHGLEEYFKFTQDERSEQFISFLIKLVYIGKLEVNDEVDVRNFIEILRHFTKPPIIETIYKYIRYECDLLSLEDAFSKGQVKSKIWLSTELSKIKKDYTTVYLIAGWFGQLTKYFEHVGINYTKLRSFDIDPVACFISDKIFNVNNIENYKVKSVQIDVTNSNWIQSNGCKYDLRKFNNEGQYVGPSRPQELTVPDLVINTSAEHFDVSWYKKFVQNSLPTDPLFVIQSNNFFDVPEHVNCVADLKELKKKFPMTRIEYEGELKLDNYSRFMLIGRP